MQGGAAADLGWCQADDNPTTPSGCAVRSVGRWLPANAGASTSTSQGFDASEDRRTWDAGGDDPRMAGSVSTSPSNRTVKLEAKHRLRGFSGRGEGVTFAR